MNWLSFGIGLVAGIAAEQLATLPLRRDSDSEVTPRPARWSKLELATPDGGVIQGVEAGSGPPLVLLHGITLQADVWHRQWALADEARVIAIDLRGHGGSEPGRCGTTIEANAEDLAFLLDALDLEGAVIAGHSMGGMVLGRFIADHLVADDPGEAAHRVGGVGFISTAGRSPVGLANDLLRLLASPVQRHAVANPDLARRVVSIPDNDLGQVMVRSVFGKRPDLRDVRETAHGFDSLEVSRFFETAPSILEHDVLDALTRCRLPAAVIVGSRDPLTPVRESRRLVSALPAASLEIVDGAGHQLMLERPAEVNAMLRDLLARAAVRTV